MVRAVAAVPGEILVRVLVPAGDWVSSWFSCCRPADVDSTSSREVRLSLCVIYVRVCLHKCSYMCMYVHMYSVFVCACFCACVEILIFVLSVFYVLVLFRATTRRRLASQSISIPALQHPRHRPKHLRTAPLTTLNLHSHKHTSTALKTSTPHLPALRGARGPERAGS